MRNSPNGTGWKRASIDSAVKEPVLPEGHQDGWEILKSGVGCLEERGRPHLPFFSIPSRPASGAASLQGQN